MKFVEFDPKTLTEVDWEAYFQSRERIQAQQSPEDPVPGECHEPHREFLYTIAISK
jgi:hypothetical protein